MAAYRRPKTTTIKVKISLTAIAMARKDGDPNYAKYKIFRKKYIQYRARILDKYSSKAKAKVYGSGASE